MKRVPYTTSARLAELLKWLRSTKPTRKEYAIGALCAAFEPLVESQALRFSSPSPGVELDDLRQVARIGVLIACKGYDAKKGPFPTRVLWCVRRELTHYLGSLERPVRLPTMLSFRLRKMHRVKAQLSNVLFREATTAEVSAALGLSEDAVLAMEAYESGPVELDATWHGGTSNDISAEEPLHETFPSPTLDPEAAMIAREALGGWYGVRSRPRSKHGSRRRVCKEPGARQRPQHRRISPRKASRRGAARR